MPALAMFALVGVLAGLWLPTAGITPLAWGLTLCGPLIWWLGGTKPLIAMIAFVIASIACHDYRALILADQLAGQDILVTGRVSNFPRQTARGQVLQLDIRRNYSAGRLPQRIQLTIYGQTPQPQVGELWQLKVRLKPPFGFVNPGGFDRSVRFLVRGVHATGYVRSSSLNKKLQSISFDSGVLLVRAHLRKRLELLLDNSEMLPLVLGITVGARDLISDSQWSLFRTTGTSHLMAISGLHIGMIAVALWRIGLLPAWIASAFGVVLNTRQFAYLLSAGGSAGYAMLAGFTIPTIRALTMVLVVLILSTYQRHINHLWILGFALLTVVLSDPLAVLSAGFWLSFAAVALLFICLTPCGEQTGQTRYKYLLRRISQMLRAQWVLGFGLALPMCLFFGQVSLTAPIANLIAVPVFTLFVLPAALVGTMLSLTATPLAAAVLQIAVVSLELLVKFLQWLSYPALSVWETGPASTGFLLLTGMGCLLLLLPRPLAAPLAGLLFIALGISVNHGARPAKVTVRLLDVGQGLAVLIQTPGHVLLYDAGPGWSGGDAGRQVVVPVLRHLGIGKIDLMVISHADNDHLGGAESVVNTIDVDEITGPPRLSLAKQSITTCLSGRRWNWDGVLFEIIHPRTHVGWSDNNASCVLQVTIDGHSLLLAGDVEAVAEIVLLGRGDLVPADIVIAPHHGSATSSTDALVNYLSPSYVIFATGYMNRWGFPSPEIVQRWGKSGACGLATSTTGALEFAYIQDRGFLLTHVAAASWNRPWPVRLSNIPACIQPVATINGTYTGL
jgi:competence protein ComEC